MFSDTENLTLPSRRRVASALLAALPIWIGLPAAMAIVNRQGRSGAGKPQAIPQAIEDPNGTGLANFYRSLQQTEEGSKVTRILHYGDSHVAADLLTGRLRRQFHNWFGSAGAGFVLAGKPWNWYSPGGVEHRASGGWTTEGLGDPPFKSGAQFGLAGLSFQTNRPGEWIFLRSAAGRYTLFFLNQPRGGAIDVLLDGELYICLSFKSKTKEPAYLNIEVDSDREHTLELRTLTDEAVKLFGIVVEKNAWGVTYDALGINGARATRPLYWDWEILESQLEQRAPDLVILAYGSNEVGDADLDLREYREKFSLLLERFRAAAPAASLLVIAPPDRATPVQGRWRTLTRMPSLVATQKQAAFKAGAAFWNLFQAMGGDGSIDQWVAKSLAQKDHVHLTRDGYGLVAEMFYRELMRGYGAFQMREK